MNIKSKYNSKDREPIVAKMDALLTQLEGHVKYLKKVNKTLNNIDSDCNTMNTYYFSEWLDDYNNFRSSENKQYLILLQDPIHNVLQEIHEEKIKMIKKIVSKLQ